jgi:hypothetical protein
MVRLIVKESGAPRIDMAPGVDGGSDDDLFLDIVHFTERDLSPKGTNGRSPDLQGSAEKGRSPSPKRPCAP